MSISDSLVAQYLKSNVNLIKNTASDLYNTYFGTTSQKEFDIYLIDPYVEDPSSPINQQQLLRLPVLPQEISIQTERKFETVELINIGEVDFQNGEKIQQLTFASFFPGAYDASYCQYPDLPDPIAAWNLLQSMTMSREKAVRLIITGADLNMLVNVAAVPVTFKGGEPDDIYFEITCRSWREVKVVVDNASIASQNNLNQRTSFKQTGKSYTVKTGDSLQIISKRELGSTSRWHEIYALNPNPKTIGPDPDLIYPGQRLVMPA